MTAKEFLNGCEHDGSYIPVNEVLRLMKEYAQEMCKQQREICANQEDMIEFSDWTTQTGVYIDKDVILNAPEPKMDE